MQPVNQSRADVLVINPITFTLRSLPFHVVIQTDAANTNPRYPNTIVLTLSTKGLNVATHVRIEPDRSNGLNETSWAKCEQILTISKDRLATLWGTVSEKDLHRIEVAAKTALALPYVNVLILPELTSLLKEPAAVPLQHYFASILSPQCTSDGESEARSLWIS